MKHIFTDIKSFSLKGFIADLNLFVKVKLYITCVSEKPVSLAKIENKLKN